VRLWPVVRSTAAAEYPLADPNSASSEALIPAAEVSLGSDRVADGAGTAERDAAGLDVAELVVAELDATELEALPAAADGSGAATSMCGDEADDCAVFVDPDRLWAMPCAASDSVAAARTRAATDARLRTIMIYILSGRPV
jgi:hypothetical protein